MFFFFNDTATTEIYTLSLHDALPIWQGAEPGTGRSAERLPGRHQIDRSEEHTSELQSLAYLVCRLLLEKKKKKLRPLHTRTPRILTTRARSTRTALMRRSIPNTHLLA